MPSICFSRRARLLSPILTSRLIKSSMHETTNGNPGNIQSTASTNEADLSRAFISQARTFLTEEYLPKIERCLEQLSDDQIWWRANPEANSVGNLILHLSGNARQWIVSGLGDQTDQRRRQSEFDERGPVARDQLLGLIRNTVAEVGAVLAGFDSTRLLTQYAIQGTNATALAAIFHVTEHFSMHTGQIIVLTRMLANVDLNFYDFSTGKPVHTWHGPRTIHETTRN